MVLCTSYSEESTPKPLELTNPLKMQDKITILKLDVFLYTKNEPSEKMIYDNNPIYKGTKIE
jgi:hypothetical protein